MTLNEELEQLGLPQVQQAPPASAPPAPAPVTAETVHPMHAQWSKWRPEFAKAMDGSFHTVDALERLIFQNRAQLWPGARAAIVTEIQDYPGERVLQALWAAGDVDEIIALIPGLESFGRLMGCTSVLVEGQKAWQRVLKPHGYGHWSTTLRKAL